jgi:SAM-dependent methyltransferase
VSAEPPLRLAFGNAAVDYERGRPAWSEEVAKVGALPRTSEVVDLGAGTGKLTRVLAARFARVVAVEPSGDMRALISGVEALGGSAEAIPLVDRSVDGVFCGDCFHWFDWPLALDEIARVLRPRGALVIGFHAPGGDTDPPYPEEATAIFDRHRRSDVKTGGHIYLSGAWREPFDESAFESLQEIVFEHDELLDRDGLVSLALSQSVCAVLADEERATLAAELLSVIPDVEYRMPVRDEIYWTRLR